MEIYTGSFAVRGKTDASPVTEADERAEALLIAGLRRLTPGVAIVAEEEVSAGRLPSQPGNDFWLVDPLDGTKEFINRNGEFTVNLAFVRDGQPVLGVVYAPAIGRLFGGAVGLGSFVEEGGTRRRICVRSAPDRGLTVLGSRSHADAAAMANFLEGRTVAESRSAGSSLKFCLLAAGEADLYPRLGRTMEWDTAAGHAVLNGAGGAVRTLDGTPLHYGKPRFENPHFVASGAEVLEQTE
jgi:3'(2'), 5'-bisphosphate nucleotidase